jgi:acyl dehydratase
VEYRCHEDVKVGETLPPLEFPITPKTLVLAVCGTRDLMPYHHNTAYSKSIGNRDMFVNTMFEQALFARFVTDWSGPESDFRETTLQMVGQLCPGDVARIEGTVASASTDRGEPRVRIEMTASNHLGLAARASATIAMPSRALGPVRPLESRAKPGVEIDPQIPDFAKAWLGDVSEPHWGGYPVSEAQISYWCDMVEDANPLYVDGDYARKSRHRGVIAPPVGLITWGMQRAGHQGVDFDAPDCDAPARRPWPPRSAARSGYKSPPGATETIAQGSAQAYGVVLRPGDRVYARSEVVNCSPRKQTRLGPGWFQTNLDTYYNQRHEIVGTNVFTLLRYGVKDVG